MRSAFYLSHLKVDVRTDNAALWREIELIWGMCRNKLVADKTVLECELIPAPGYGIRWKGFGTDSVLCAEEVVPRLEAWVYSELKRAHAAHEMALHAAGVVFNRQVLLFIGPSGAGKSSLALAALDQGCTYISDEIVCFNQEVCWGVPRAIQFDVRSQTETLPRRLQRKDVLLRQVVHDHDDIGRAPIIRLGPDQVIRAPVSSRDMWLIFPTRSDANAVASCEQLTALQGVLEASMVKPAFDLGWLIKQGKCLRLSWNDPASAMDLLIRRMQL